MWPLPLRLRSALLLGMWLLCMWLLCMWLLCMWLLCMRLLCRRLLQLWLLLRMLSPLLLVQQLLLILPLVLLSYTRVVLIGKPCRLLPIKRGLQRWILLLSIHCSQLRGCCRVSVRVWKGVGLGLSRGCLWMGGRWQGGLASRGA